jgi:uncharacterized protein (DUF2384 family)
MKPDMSGLEERAHNPNSQRLDARGIAGMLGLSIPQLAKAIGRDYDAVRKTPDSQSLQVPLAQLYRIWDLAYEALNEEEQAVRRWLSRPNRELDLARPLDLLVPQRLDELEETVRRMRDGDYA